MNANEFWAAIAARNSWTDESRIECTGKGLRMLVEKAFAKGVAAGQDAAQKPSSSLLDDIFGDIIGNSVGANSKKRP